VGEVEKSGGFVQQHIGGFLSERSRDQGFLTFAVAELIEMTFSERAAVDRIERPFDTFAIVPVEIAGPVCMRMAAKGDEGVDAHRSNRN